MMSIRDFEAKQIVFVFLQQKEKLSFKNDNLVVPEKTEYEIEVLYKPDGIKSLYKVNLYEDVCVMQDINIVPEIKVGGFNGNWISCGAK